MNNRIKELREQSLQAINTISSERAKLLTTYMKSGEFQKHSLPVARALTFKYIMLNKELYVDDNELIVGERGPKPKACPTYPEICLHSVEDLKILNDREKVSFKVDAEVLKDYEEEIIPYWFGKTNRDRIMNAMTPEWHDAYKAGIFTEFQEQRAPGHTVLGKKMFFMGMKDIKKEIKESLSNLDFIQDDKAFDKKQELMAMEIVADTIVAFSRRYAQKYKELAQLEKDNLKKHHYLKIADVCTQVPENAPRTFHEALQHYWFIHLGVVTELNPWDSFSPGRLDQHLMPFYEKETQANILNEELAKELLQAFWIKFNNHPAPPKMGVTAKESNTYTDFSLINLGGVKEDGSNAVNPMSFIILDVIEEMRLLQPSSMIQLSKKNPDAFLKRALKIVKTGFGQPSIFNTDELIQELLVQGKDIVDARNGGCSGCVETGAFGTESYFLTGYFNLAKIMEITLNNGFDKYTQKQIGLKTGNPRNFKNFNELVEAWQKQVAYFVNIKLVGNNCIESINAQYMPVPFLSILIEDCIKNAKDYNAGGARYNTSYVQGVGLGSLTDIMTSIQYNVFDYNKITMSELLSAMDANFEGFEKLRSDLLYNTPKYGNDEDYADDNSRIIFDTFYQSVTGKPTARGGKFRINMLPTTCHVYFGNVMQASADGRKCAMPLSEGISPFQGADTLGPTAVIKSASKIDHIKTGGTLLNQKFTPDILSTEEGLGKVLHLVRAYFRMDGHHIQFNVIDAETLKQAQKKPEEYKDLIVRVAGYSDYFNDCGEDLQNEIIRRTEHNEF